MLRTWIACAVLVGCPTRPAPQGPGKAEAQGATARTPSRLQAGASLARPLIDVACSHATCWVATADGVARLDPIGLTTSDPIAVPLQSDVVLHADGDGVAVERSQGEHTTLQVLEAAGLGEPVPLELVAPQDDEGQVGLAGQRWQRVLDRGERIGFHAAWPTPDGATLMFDTASIGNSATVLKLGRGPRAMAVARPQTRTAYPGGLAMHPTGRQAYVIAWPGAMLTAFDPTSLGKAWQLPLTPAAYGLFVDPTGRFLVAGIGGAVGEDRLLDWPLEGPREPNEDPVSDPALRRRVLPPSTRTAVVDLVLGEVVADMAGAYRRWIPLTDGAFLLATTSGVVRLSGE